jgi:hypothetical protein
VKQITELSLRRIASAAAIILLSASLCPAQTGKIQALPALTDASVPEAVRQALEPKGERVTLDDASIACEIWLRKEIPAQAKKDVEGALYPELAESTLVGVLQFPQASSDYRGQAIPAGFYTLRYELLPNDGNHLGAAPNRDFLLLIPASADPDPKASFNFQELVNLSRKATRTKHPGPLNLVQAESKGTEPAVSKDDQDHWIYSAGMKLASGREMPFALVVKGTAQQ